MKTFQIYREDIKKIVCKSINANDFEDAAAKYVSVLMIAGMVKMTDSACELLKDSIFRIKKSDGAFFDVTIKEI